MEIRKALHEMTDDELGHTYLVRLRELDNARDAVSRVEDEVWERRRQALHGES